LPCGKIKIPHQEIQRFIDENTNRETKYSPIITVKADLNNFINGRKDLEIKQFNSTELFNTLMEKNNG